MAVFRSLGVIVRIEMMDILVCIQKNLFAHKEISGIAVRIKAIGILFARLSPWTALSTVETFKFAEGFAVSNAKRIIAIHSNVKWS